MDFFEPITLHRKLPDRGQQLGSLGFQLLFFRPDLLFPLAFAEYPRRVLQKFPLPVA